MPLSPEKMQNMLGAAAEKFGQPKTPEKTAEAPQENKGAETGAQVIDLARVRQALAERKLKTSTADAGRQTESAAQNITPESVKIADIQRAIQKLQRELENIAADQKLLDKDPAYFKTGPDAKSESGKKIQKEMRAGTLYEPKQGIERMSADAAQVGEELESKKQESAFIAAHAQTSEAQENRLAA